MNRAYYSNSIAASLGTQAEEILGLLAKGIEFALEQTQRDAWLEEINILRPARSHSSLFLSPAYPAPGPQ